MDEIRIRTIKEWEDQGILDMIMEGIVVPEIIGNQIFYQTQFCLCYIILLYLINKYKNNVRFENI